MLVLQILFVVIGVIFIGIGIKNGEPDKVLQRAIRVCLECIGIG